MIKPAVWFFILPVLVVWSESFSSTQKQLPIPKKYAVQHQAAQIQKGNSRQVFDSLLNQALEKIAQDAGIPVSDFLKRFENPTNVQLARGKHIVAGDKINLSRKNDPFFMESLLNKAKKGDRLIWIFKEKKGKLHIYTMPFPI